MPGAVPAGPALPPPPPLSPLCARRCRCGPAAMSFLLEWLYNGFSSVLQFLGEPPRTGTGLGRSRV